MPVDPKSYKDALGRFASGVTVVSVEHAGEVVGITVSAFLSVSLDPPLVLVSIDKRARAHAALAAAPGFAVSLLAAGQEGVSNYFAGWKQPGQVVDLARTDRGAAVVPDALAWLECTLHQAVEAGDHTLYLGLVEAITVRDADPLLYFRGKYRAITPV